MLRRVHCGTSAGEALIGFTAGTGITGVLLLARLEAALKGLVAE